MKPRVAFIVDNPWRDLPALTLAAAQLCGRGYSCFLVPYALQESELWVLQPSVVVLNYLRTNNTHFVRRLQEAGIRVVLHDTEGGVLSYLPQSALADPASLSHLPSIKPEDPVINYALTMCRDAQVRQRVARVCSWSTVMSDYFVTMGLYRQDQVVTTGTPRTDLLTPRFRKASKALRQDVEDYPSPLVLINASFPLANPAFLTPEQELQLLKKEFGFCSSFVERWQKEQAAGLKAIVSLTKQLCQTFPEVTFILRPHPFEKQATYENALAGPPNLHFIKKGVVAEWLLRCRALIHFGSSTAIEAGVVGIPALQPQWIPIQHPNPNVVNASCNCTSPQELIDTLRSILNNTFQLSSDHQKKIRQSVENCFFCDDGQSAQRLVKTLEDVATEEKGTHLHHARCRYRAFSLFSQAKAWQRHLKAFLFDWLGLSLHRNFLLQNKARTLLPYDKTAKAFQLHEVQAIITALEKAEGGLPHAVKASWAQETQSYAWGFSEGRSILLQATSSTH